MPSARPLAVITGASSGIGDGFARGLAERGCDCVIIARRRDRLEALASELRAAHNVEVTVLEVDLALPEGPKRVFDEVQALGRPVAWLVNNAGYGMFGLFLDQRATDLRHMMQLNMWAVMELTHLFLPGMVAARSGRVVQVSSVGAFQPSPRYAVYSATKAFVRDFSQAVDRELVGTGVTVTSVCPGLTTSEFHKVAVHRPPSYWKSFTLPARVVAESAIRGAERGRAHVTPGLLYLWMGWATKWAPRSVATLLADYATR